MESPLPAAMTRTYTDQRSKWLDIECRVELMLWEIEHTDFYGDALPIVWPNMGPEIFSAWCGSGDDFDDTIAWSSPTILTGSAMDRRFGWM